MLSREESNEVREILKSFKEDKFKIKERVDDIERHIRYIPDKCAENYEKHGWEFVLINKGIRKSLAKLEDKQDALSKSVRQSYDRIEFLIKQIVIKERGYDIVSCDKKINLEDDVFHKIPQIIKDQHSLQIKNVELHKRVDGVEYDCLMTCKTYLGTQDRIVGVEFKDVDVEKVMAQALVRHKHVHCQYVAINSSISWIYSNIVKDFPTFDKKGIGIICFVGSNPVLLLPAKMRRNKTS